MRKFKTLSEAYLATLEEVLDRPEYTCSPRGQKIYEITDYSFRVEDPTPEPIITLDSTRNVTIASYTEKEKVLYNSCSNRVEDFARASKFWEKLANPDGTVNSAYGALIWKDKSLGNTDFDSDMLTPWEWSKAALMADKDTRQATMPFSRPDHFWNDNKDFVCTRHVQWQIRDDKLNMSVVMRSNDLVKGTVYDCPWFVGLMFKMIDELKLAYPQLQIGHYTHLAHSIHLYEKDIPIILGMLGRKND